MIRRILVLISAFGLIATCLVLPQRLQAEQIKPTALKPNEYLRGTFELARKLDGFEKPLLSRGEFILSPKHGLVWQTKSPFPSVTILEEAGIFTVDEDGKRNAMATGSEIRQFVTMISSVLSGNWEQLKSQFDIKKDFSKTNSWCVFLTPHTNNIIADQVEKIKVRGNVFVQEMMIQKPFSDQDLITFEGQAVEPLPLPSEFSNLFINGTAK